MEQQKNTEIILNKENKEKVYNPNSIGELLSIGRDLLTSPDKVYRSVSTKEAIDDIEKSGVVRNKQSAGLVEKSRWGERVFWSKGGEGKYHSVAKDGYVIESPLSIAQERVVTKEDITAIYTKNENGEVFDILKQKKDEAIEQKQREAEEHKKQDEAKLVEIRKRLGIE